MLSPTPSNGFYHVNYQGSVGSRSWCYSTGWPTSARYAADKAAALRSIREIMAIHYALAP